MKTIVAFLVTLVFANPVNAKETPDFLRFQNCKKSGYLCGQCEGAAEVPLRTLISDFENTSTSITEVLKEVVQRYEKRLGAKFVPIYLANSPSLMSADFDHPKVILKSPESEVIIAFNTDPKREAFHSIETMRFDGKRAKFILEKVELADQKVRIVENPAECKRCHGEQSKPLWDTYRAWPGMVGGRDDLVEKNSVMTPFTLDLFKKIESKSDSRLASTHPTTTSIEISNHLDKNEWYRTPHIPKVPKLKNRSLRTAVHAGPGHVMFDQLSANLACVMTKDLKSILTKKEATTLSKMIRLWKPGMAAPLTEKMLNEALISQKMDHQYAVRYQEVLRTHSKDTVLKVERQHSYLQSLGASEEVAWNESFKRSVPFVTAWFAVPDPGGYQAVPESDPQMIAFIDLLLEKHGRRISEWSMSLGPVIQSGFQSFSFSDQFVRSLQSAGF